MKEKIIDIIFNGKITLPMKYINALCYYIIPAWALLYVFVPYFLGNNAYYNNAIDLGSVAFYILLGLLFIKPLTLIFSDIRIFAKLLILRKQFWVLMFWFFVWHASGAILSIGYRDIILLIQAQTYQSYFVWGILAGIIVFLLWITSNLYSMKLLKKNWKRLHKLVYPALLFVALHIYFIAGDVWPLGITLLYWVVKFIAWRWIKIPVKKYVLPQETISH
jgi:DMSO/TMAO reductase YedYZ heme-binding membrane subunit